MAPCTRFSRLRPPRPYRRRQSLLRDECPQRIVGLTADRDDRLRRVTAYRHRWLGQRAHRLLPSVDTEYEGIYHATNACGSVVRRYLIQDNYVQHGVDMKMTADGTMHLAWGGSPIGYGGGLFYAKYATGILTVTNISTTSYGGASGATLAMAPNGSAWIAYESSVSATSGITVMTNDGGSWHPSITAFGGGGTAQVPTLGVGSDAKVHLLWYSQSSFGIIQSIADGTATGNSLAIFRAVRNDLLTGGRSPLLASETTPVIIPWSS